MITRPVLLSLLLIACQADAAEAEKPVQALIVFDVSGSMRQSDPNHLSVAAAQLFGNLSRPHDAVGLAVFSDRAELLIPIGAGDDANAKETLQRSLKKLQFNGQTTDLAAALDTGLAAFREQTDSSHRRLVLLLTDGALDLGKNRESQEAEARTRILNALLPEYHRRDISLYTIAFTASADRGLLDEMSAASAGESRFVGDAQALHQAFSQIFISAGGAQSFPLDQGSLRIDESIKELSLVFAKSAPDEHIALLTPQRKTVQAGTTAEGMTWQSTPAYDLVRMHQPEPGTWQIERSGDVQGGVGIIAESTLDLQIELGTTFIETGATLTIRSFLEDKSQTPTSMHHEEGQVIAAELKAPEEPAVDLPLTPQADGSFSASSGVLNAPGTYTVTVTVTTPTLQRQRTRIFEVHPECFQGSISQASPGKVQVALHSSCPSFKSLSIEAEYASANAAKQQVPLHEVQPHLFEADLHSDAGAEQSQVNVIIHGEGPEGPFTLTKGPLPLPKEAAPIASPAPAVTPEPPTEEKRLVWVRDLIIGVLLLVTAVLAMLLRRSHKARQQLIAQLASQDAPATEATPTPAPVETPEAAPEAPAAEVEAVAIAPLETDTPPAVEEPAPAGVSPDTALDTGAIDPLPTDISGASLSSDLEELREIIDNANLDESTDRLQQRLDATQQTLQELAVDLDQLPTDSGEHRVDIEPLRNNLKEISAEVDSLQQNNAQLQRDLREKAQDMEQAIIKTQDNTDLVLHHAKKLRRDMTMMREKLRNRESDVQELETVNAQLAAEYEALMKEYERIYAKSTK